MQFSDQIDVVIYDRQYSPFVFQFEEQAVIPAESAYAVFEVKLSINLDNINYAKNKINSVRLFKRTSLPIPYAVGIYRPKKLSRILGGILTLESDWKPTLGPPMYNALGNPNSDDSLDLGCIANHGYFTIDTETDSYSIRTDNKPNVRFLFVLM